MVESEAGSKREKRKKRPLDEASLRDLALSYAARFATTAAKLEMYLHRKIRERGVVDDAGQIDVRAIVDRLVELRYVDDEAYAKARSGSLLRRGYGAKRVSEALRHAGVDENTCEQAAPNAVTAREAAITMARKRRFGPFGLHEQAGLEGSDDTHGDDQPPRLDPAKREKQIAAMLRAGHGFDTAKLLIDARSIDEVEDWLAEAIDEAREDEDDDAIWGR